MKIAKTNQTPCDFMKHAESIKNKMTPEFIDYCNDRGIDLVKWYRWQLHLLWERRRISRILR